MKEHIINYKNSNIHYQIHGKGFPVVLLHGFAEDSNIWCKQVEALKTKNKIIIPDLPGSGKSELFNDVEGTIENYALCINAILKAEKIEQCIMIGHSMGGYITLAFADLFPEKLKGFGLFHSTSYADDAEKKETRKKAIGFIQTHGSEAFLKSSIHGLFYTTDNSIHPEAFKLLDSSKNFTAKALIQYYKAMIARPDRTYVLKNSGIPVLIIAGKHDNAVPVIHSLEQTHIAEQTYMHILRGSAHMGMLEETQKSNKILSNFIAQSCK